MEKGTLEKTRPEESESNAQKEKREKILAWIWLPLLILILLLMIWTGTAHMVYTGGTSAETTTVESVLPVSGRIWDMQAVL